MFSHSTISPLSFFFLLLNSFLPSITVQCPIVERLTNSLMMHGRNNGKKLMAVRIVKHAFEIIHLLTGEVGNLPMQPPVVVECRVQCILNNFASMLISALNPSSFPIEHQPTNIPLYPHAHRTHCKCWWMPSPTVARGRTQLELDVLEL